MENDMLRRSWPPSLSVHHHSTLCVNFLRPSTCCGVGALPKRDDVATMQQLTNDADPWAIVSVGCQSSRAVTSGGAGIAITFWVLMRVASTRRGQASVKAGSSSSGAASAGSRPHQVSAGGPAWGRHARAERRRHRRRHGHQDPVVDARGHHQAQPGGGDRRQLEQLRATCGAASGTRSAPEACGAPPRPRSAPPAPPWSL